MKNVLLTFILISGICFSQETNKFAIEFKGNTFTGLGNNFVADGTKTFTGFGAGFTGTFYKNFGLGIEFNKGYSEVSDVSVFGDLHSPQLTLFDIYALYRYDVNQKLSIEGNIGGGFSQLKSYSDYRIEKFTEGGNTFFLGGKALYSVTKNNSLVLVAGPRFYFMHTFTEMDDPKIQKYYSKATLLNFSLGLRLCF
ncbi:porin family protein [Kaistella faecalis]|uniref:porin family protein n=1 Tax=Kaistella faecalis TaxID=2852098 RepID=UPI001C478DD1|nr:porin family protein [Chryseobacterium faecale]UFK98877.1 porin family protein [Chryseobacterium faecale]